MISYLTFNDGPSGIYSSQVIDVVKFIRSELKKDIRLIALISGRNYFKQRKKIKSEEPDAIVLPMFPGVKNWKKNLTILNLIPTLKKSELVIGRSVLATQLALNMKKKTVYDGRGAIAAEWKEYGVISDQQMLKEIFTWEKECVQKADYRIAVSQQLLNYWMKEYAYASTKHAVIPCTVNQLYENIILTDKSVTESRARFNFQPDEPVFVYSGSVAGWQSFTLLDKFIREQLEQFPKSKVLFLSEETEEIKALKADFNSRVISKKVSHAEVPACLIAADYGLLIREKSITNKVASPVKFGEYLACGLKVIISDELGDASEFVKVHRCGSVYSEFSSAEKISLTDKLAMRQIASEYFNKKSFIKAYIKMLEA